MPAYIIRRLPPTIDHPGGGAAVCLPTTGRIVARFPATVDSRESMELAERRARDHAKALRQAATAAQLELQLAADKAAEREAWGEGDATPAAEAAWVDMQAAFAAAWEGTAPLVAELRAAGGPAAKALAAALETPQPAPPPAPAAKPNGSVAPPVSPPRYGPKRPVVDLDF